MEGTSIFLLPIFLSLLVHVELGERETRVVLLSYLELLFLVLSLLFAARSLGETNRQDVQYVVDIRLCLPERDEGKGSTRVPAAWKCRGEEKQNKTKKCFDWQSTDVFLLLDYNIRDDLSDSHSVKTMKTAAVADEMRFTSASSSSGGLFIGLWPVAGCVFRAVHRLNNPSGS